MKANANLAEKSYETHLYGNITTTIFFNLFIAQAIVKIKLSYHHYKDFDCSCSKAMKDRVSLEKNVEGKLGEGARLKSLLTGKCWVGTLT